MPTRHKKVLVVVTTSGTELDLGRIKNVVHNIGEKSRKLKLNPVFLVSCYTNRSGVEKKLSDSEEKVSFVDAPKNGYGNALLSGFAKGIREHKPDYVLPFPADFVGESEHVDKLLKPLIGGVNADFVAGRWVREGYSSALEYPLPQYLNETRITGGLIYADPHFHPTDLRIFPAINEALRKGSKLQTYTGMWAFKARHWKTIAKHLFTSLKGAESEYGQFGFEPAVLLSVLHSNLKIASPTVERGYEHDDPTPQERDSIIEKRLQQFHQGVHVIRTFLKNSGQTEKIPHFEKYAEIVERRLRSSPLFRERHKELIEKFKPKFLYHK